MIFPSCRTHEATTPAPGRTFSLAVVVSFRALSLIMGSDLTARFHCSCSVPRSRRRRATLFILTRHGSSIYRYVTNDTPNTAASIKQ